MDLKPLIVVTGAVHVEGGHKQRRVDAGAHATTDPTLARGGRVVVQRHSVSADRLAANTIATGFMRKLRGLRLLKTPLGTLIDMQELPKVKALIAEADDQCGRFNSSKRSCLAVNCMVWEVLKGNRLMAIRGWLELLHDVEEITAALPKLTLPHAA